MGTSITKVDCYCYRGPAASGDTSSYALLNPAKEPGALVMAGACAARESISSQVACRLSLEHFVEGVLDFFSPSSEVVTGVDTRTAERSLEVLESAFRNANSSVYSFGHKLAAGGRMAASLIGLVLDHGVVAAGRVGEGSAFLMRGGELFPFFEEKESASEDRPSADFVGANSLVSVELASVPVQEEDFIFVFSEQPSGDFEGQLMEASGNFKEQGASFCKEISGRLFQDPTTVPFAIFTQLGPQTIYLSPAVGS